MKLIDELIHYLQANEEEINAMHYGSLTFVIQEGKVYTATLAKEQKRGKDLLFQSLKSEPAVKS